MWKSPTTVSIRGYLCLVAVQSVDRALRLLETIGEMPCGLAEAAARVDLPISTASRILATMEERDVVSRRVDGVYVIGAMVQRLVGSETVSSSSLQAAAHAELIALSDKLGEAAALSVPIGNQTLTLVQVDAPKPVQAQDWTGHRWSITGGGTGAVMMSTWDAARVDPLLADLSSAQRTDLRREIAEARRRGVSWSRGAYVEGLTSVAAPVVLPTGEAVGALLVYGPSYRFPTKGASRRTEKLVVLAARRASKQLVA